MTDAEREAILARHIPYRMTAVDGMRWACRHLIAHGGDGPLWFRLKGVDLFGSETVRILTNPVIEVGAMYCRVLLEFMGLELDRRATPPVMREMLGPRWDDDIGIEDFGLPRVTLADLAAVYPEHPEHPAETAATALNIADKAIAHLTRAPLDIEALPQLSDCGLATLRLMERHVYGALKRDIPDYLNGWPRPNVVKGGAVSGARRIFLSVGFLAIAAMGLFPPWVTAPEGHPSSTTPAGFHFILQPPSAGPAGPVVWSSKHQRFERGGKAVDTSKPDPWVEKFDRIFGYRTAGDGSALAGRFVRIDYALLGIEWMVVAALVGVAMVVTGPRRRAGS